MRPVVIFFIYCLCFYSCISKPQTLLNSTESLTDQKDSKPQIPLNSTELLTDQEDDKPQTPFNSTELLNDQEAFKPQIQIPPNFAGLLTDKEAIGNFIHTFLTIKLTTTALTCKKCYFIR